MSRRLRWLAEGLQGRPALLWAALGLGAAVIAWLAWPREGPLPVPAARSAAMAADAGSLPTTAVRTADVAARSAVSAASAAPTAWPSCPHAQIDLTGLAGAAGEPPLRWRACLAAARVSQTGDVRMWFFDPVGLSPWKLRIEAVGGEVTAARLEQRAASTLDTPRAWGCGLGGCAGWSLSRPDAHGQRVLRAEGAWLTRVPGGQALGDEGNPLSTPASADAAPATAAAPGALTSSPVTSVATPSTTLSATLSATTVATPTPTKVATPVAGPAGAHPPRPGLRLQASLRLPADHQTEALACRGPSLMRVDADGAAAEFCPDGGAALARLDDGAQVFSFQTLQGETLRIGLGVDGAVTEVQVGGLACRALGCIGLVVSPIASVDAPPEHPSADPADRPPADRSGRQFLFNGTVLEAPGGTPHATTLTGRLVAPPS